MLSLMEVTEVGMVIDAREVQEEKASTLMVFTEVDMAMEVR